MRYEEGAQVDFMLGVGMDEHSSPVKRCAQGQGENHQGCHEQPQLTDYGNSALVTFGDYTVQVTDIRVMMSMSNGKGQDHSANTM